MPPVNFLEITYRGLGLGGTLLIVLFLSAPRPAAAAGDDVGDWMLEPGFGVRMATYYRYKDGVGTTYPALGAHLNLQLSAPDRPVAAGMFVDYELATRDEHSGLRLAGSWVRYRVGRWELSTAGVHLAAPRAGGQWLRVSKLKFDPRPGHSLALEALGPMRGGGEPALQLVYATDLSKSVCLTVEIGLGANPIQDVGVSTRFNWSLF